MAVSDAILARLLRLHPKVIDLNLYRINRLLDRLGNPEKRLPPVVHVAGTNGKGSVIATLRAIMETAGLKVHTYTSPHLVKFHERIRLAGLQESEPIAEAELIELLEECETANGAEPITFFEITTAAAFLAFSRTPADYLLLEVGLGGRLDATNVIETAALSIITPVDLDHQQFLGERIGQIAFEKAGILKPAVPAVAGPQHPEALEVIEAQAAKLNIPLSIAGEHWQAFEQHGRLVFEDERQLLDLPLSNLVGRFQIANAGMAIAGISVLGDERIKRTDIEAGLREVDWPARMHSLNSGVLADRFGPSVDVWLDGGHNPAAGRAASEVLADLNDQQPKPTIMIVGMLNSKSPRDYLSSFEGLVQQIISVPIPGEENAIPADELADIAKELGIEATTADTLEDAFDLVHAGDEPHLRLFIGGSLYLAGHVLAIDRNKTPSVVSGTSNKRET